MRVLIADDQKSVGTSLAEMVGLCHHQVVEVVGTGMEAIQAYDRHRPDVVLMDYRMPKLNGITACRYILAKDPKARVILISGWSAPVEPEASGATAIHQAGRSADARRSPYRGDATQKAKRASGGNRRCDASPGGRLYGARVHIALKMAAPLPPIA